MIVDTADFSKGQRALMFIAALVVVPLTVGIITWVYNQNQAMAQHSAQMTAIAVGVLQDTQTSPGSQPLREWAISVLQTPSEAPSLSNEAAAALREGARLSSLDSASAIFRALQATESAASMREKLDNFENFGGRKSILDLTVP